MGYQAWLPASNRRRNPCDGFPWAVLCILQYDCCWTEIEGELCALQLISEVNLRTVHVRAGTAVTCTTWMLLTFCTTYSLTKFWCGFVDNQNLYMWMCILFVWLPLSPPLPCNWWCCLAELENVCTIFVCNAGVVSFCKATVWPLTTVKTWKLCLKKLTWYVSKAHTHTHTHTHISYVLQTVTLALYSFMQHGFDYTYLICV